MKHFPKHKPHPLQHFNFFITCQERTETHVYTTGVPDHQGGHPRLIRDFRSGLPLLVRPFLPRAGEVGCHVRSQRSAETTLFGMWGCKAGGGGGGQLKKFHKRSSKVEEVRLAVSLKNIFYLSFSFHRYFKFIDSGRLEWSSSRGLVAGKARMEVCYYGLLWVTTTGPLYVVVGAFTSCHSKLYFNGKSKK